jgi:RNA polymerase sigma-70 factor (ECF subfamily)
VRQVPQQEESILLQRLQAGDEQAFSEIYNLFATELIAFTTARISSLEEARDIIHDLFVYVWEERANLSIKISFRAFLFAAARYRIIDHIRFKDIRRKYADKLTSLPTSFVAAPESELNAKELNQALNAAVNELSPKVQEVYRLSRNEHLSIREIATQLNRSEQTVKNQLSTALAQLRVLLEKILILVILFL